MDLRLFRLVGVIGGVAIADPDGRVMSLMGFLMISVAQPLLCALIVASLSGGGAWDRIAMAGLLAFLIFLLSDVITALLGTVKRKSDT